MAKNELLDKWWQRPQPAWVTIVVSLLLFSGLLGLWNIAQASFASEAGIANSATATASTLSYQGFVTNSSGTPLDGNQNFVFRLFPSSSGGTDLLTETHNSVPVTEGLFNIILGSKTTGGIPDTIWENPIYLETEVNGETLSPRELIKLPIASKSLSQPLFGFGKATIQKSSEQPVHGNVTIPLAPYGFTDTPTTALCTVTGSGAYRWVCHAEFYTPTNLTIWAVRWDGGTDWETVDVNWIAVKE